MPQKSPPRRGGIYALTENVALHFTLNQDKIGSSFLDLEGDTEREIDIIASRLVNDISVHFVIECKQSVLDKWVFICTKGNSNRFYYSVKHFPHIDLDILKEKKLFSHFHTLDFKVPLAHNYICYSVATNKKTDHLQIDECVHKLPKALVDFASRAQGGNHIFLPVALFSGQIFAVTYKGSLVVEETPFLEYYKSFRSDAYRREPEREIVMLESLKLPGLAELERSLKRSREDRIRKTARDLGSNYQIDFVSEAGLPEYISTVEKEVAAVRTGDWPLPTPPSETPTH
jgi:hypothetical protein